MLGRWIIQLLAEKEDIQMRVVNIGTLLLLILGFVFAGLTMATPIDIDDLTPLQGSYELPDWWYSGDTGDEEPETPDPNAKFEKTQTKCWEAECSNGEEKVIKSTACKADGTETCSKQSCSEAFTAWYNDKCK